MYLTDLAEISNVSCGIPKAGATQTSGWFSAIGMTKMHFIITMDATDEDITVTPQQATASDGSGAKALNVQRTYSKEDTATAYTRVDTAAATSVLAPGAAVATYVIEIDVDSMDNTNNFDHIQIGMTGSTSRVLSVCCVPMVGV
jgi:hypothetical protein